MKLELNKTDRNKVLILSLVSVIGVILLITFSVLISKIPNWMNDNSNVTNYWLGYFYSVLIAIGISFFIVGFVINLKFFSNFLEAHRENKKILESKGKNDDRSKYTKKRNK